MLKMLKDLTRMQNFRCVFSYNLLVNDKDDTNR